MNSMFYCTGVALVCFIMVKVDFNNQSVSFKESNLICCRLEFFYAYRDSTTDGIGFDLVFDSRLTSKTLKMKFEIRKEKSFGSHLVTLNPYAI